MSSLDNLPQDQRAVLQLVLSRGRSYEQIAQLLKINPASVRERAHSALSALGPDTQVSPENQGRIADYLLGQLSGPSETDAVRDLLAQSPGERAWARVVASELAPLATGELPEIPPEAEAPRQAAPAVAAPAASAATTPSAATAAAATPAADAGQSQSSDGEAGRRSSRLGGIIVLAAVVVAVAVALFFVLRSNGSGPQHQAAAGTTPTTASTPAASATTPTTSSSSSTTAAKVVAQINLTPAHTGSKAVGIAEVLDEGSAQGVAIVAQNVPPNSKKPPNAYAVWVYNSPSDAHILGFVNPGVGSNGRLSTAGPLPKNIKHYKKLIVTVETNGKPKSPGPIILQGALPAG
jgi:hypothetical protein